MSWRKHRQPWRRMRPRKRKPLDTRYKELLRQHNPKYIIGIDEVGWGAIAGPIVVSAVMLHVDCDSSVLKDSKKFGSSKAREKVYDVIVKDIAAYVSVETVDAAMIAYLGPGQAIQNALRSVVTDVMSYGTEYNNAVATDCLIVLDGNHCIKECSERHFCFPKADTFVPAVSAASIVAKVRRDNIMRGLSDQYPEYEWFKNKGYGTAQHIRSLREFGVSQEHRTNIAVVANSLSKYGKYEDRRSYEEGS